MSSTIGKTISCRAAVLWTEGKPMTIENITVDPPKTGEVRVRMVSAGLCASDGHFVWGEQTTVAFNFEGNPVVLGHEGSGIIESVGLDVTNVNVGDQVLMIFMPECGQCQLCTNPQTNFCLNASPLTNFWHQNKETRLNVNGKPLLIIGGIGAYSEYTVVRSIQVIKLKPSADLKKLCIISCAVGTGYGSATNIAKVHSGSKCGVWGLGAIGLSTVLGCKQSGAKTIIGVDINPDKEGIARQFGCTDFVNPKTIDEPIESLIQREGGLDYAFECIGNQQTMDSGYKSLSPWGSLTVIGVGSKENKVVVKAGDLNVGRCVLGGLYGNMKRKDINELIDKYSTGCLPIDGLITRRIRLDDINQGFDDLKAGKTIRTVIDF